MDLNSSLTQHYFQILCVNFRYVPECGLVVVCQVMAVVMMTFIKLTSDNSSWNISLEKSEPTLSHGVPMQIRIRRLPVTMPRTLQLCPWWWFNCWEEIHKLFFYTFPLEWHPFTLLRLQRDRPTNTGRKRQSCFSGWLNNMWYVERNVIAMPKGRRE